jgi:class 3 adenylate cyclase/CHASE2 domain-containing sensor protein
MSVLAFFRRSAVRGIPLGLFCALAVWLLSWTELGRGLEDWMLDGCFSWRGVRASRSNVVLIALDEPSLRELVKPAVCISPELARVVRYVRLQGATAIGIDLMVPEEMSALDDILLLGSPGDARPMRDVMLEADNVVLPQQLIEDEWQRPLLQWQARALHPEKRSFTDLGFVDLTEDGDQFIRRQQLLARREKEASAQFALALYARARKEEVTWDGQGRPLVGDRPVPVEADGALRINYVGPPGTIPAVSFKDVLADAKARRTRPELAGAVVILGVTARSHQDYHPTPYANHYARWLGQQEPGLMSGPEVQANIYATLEDGGYIRAPWWLSPLPMLLVFGAALGWAFARLDLRRGLLLAAAHHFAWKGLALAGFALFAWRIRLMAMLLLGAVVYAAAFLHRWRTLRRMFGLTKSEAVALALERDPDRLESAGEERAVTVLFADIRGFTDFSEGHTPQQVVALLNAYFDAVVALIEAEGGVIDKYMGDGIMALFGAPASLPDHALRAARAAVAMVRRVHERRSDWARLGNPALRIGVGVNTGKAVVGAIGSRGRLDYTAIGDSVNAASRIASENKEQGTEILLSAATVAALPAGEGAKLGLEKEPRRVHVKGKTEELLLYAAIVPESTARKKGSAEGGIPVR